jgi:hypothetical protein
MQFIKMFDNDFFLVWLILVFFYIVDYHMKPDTQPMLVNILRHKVIMKTEMQIVSITWWYIA